MGDHLKRKDLLLSVVVPFYNQAHLVAPFLKATYQTVEAQFDQFEILVIDDGSSDSTSHAVNDYLNHFPGIRLIRLSRHFGIDIAVTAGLEAVIGDYCVVLMPGIDPPHLIPTFVDTCEKSGAVVLGERQDPREGGAVFQLGKRIFHYICDNVLKLNMSKNTTYFVCLNRKAVHEINATKDHLRLLRAITASVGLPTVTIPYKFDQESQGKPKTLRPFWQSVGLSIDVIVTHSLRPLRFTAIGFCIFGFAAGCYSLFLVVLLVLRYRAEPLSLLAALQQSVIFSFFSFGMSVVSFYLERLLQETAQRPLYYVIEDKASSSPVAHAERRNVLSEAQIKDE